MSDESSWPLWNFNMVHYNFYVFELVYIKISVHSLHCEHSQSYTSFVKRRHYTSLKIFQFLQMYIVLILQGRESKPFLKCECLYYKRCGILCSHVLKITNEIEASMIKVQHWKIYPVHVGGENDMLSNELMKLTSIQCSNKNMGVPISDASYRECQKILDNRYVPHICLF